MIVYNEKSEHNSYKSGLPDNTLNIHPKEVAGKTPSSVLKPENIQFLRSLNLKVRHNAEYKKD